MNQVFGYCRVSTSRQSIERQIRNILAEYPSARIYQEAYTGRKIAGRKEFDKLIKAVRPGDTIVFDSVSRMSRNADEGTATYFELFSKGINLVFLKEHHIDTATYTEKLESQIEAIKTGDDTTDKLINAIIEALREYMASLARQQIRLAFEQSQKEVDDLSQRTKEGIETARRAGKQIGQRRESKLVRKKSSRVKELIRKHSQDFSGTLKDTECMALINGLNDCSVSRNTFYKYKRELSEAVTG